ncbi:MAG: Npt1/Npt2 family nucleotide transporter, partial [Cyclobacteriaceae bacterium]
MLKLARKIFDIRRGEMKVTLLLQGYIFLVVATLLIIKPAVNALFISELGPDSLPSAYLLVALAAVLSSYVYTKATQRFDIQVIIRFTLIISIVLLIVLGVLLHLKMVNGIVLYLFYAIVAIYGVLATSQFWMMANLVFNVREAKRLFGFIGSGAIVGGIFGGYLTTFLTPLVGGENLFFVAAFFLVLSLPVPEILWKMKMSHLSTFRHKKRQLPREENPITLIKSSKHLLYITAIVATGVFVARLVDYQFSSIAVSKFSDTDELTSFFGFWLSTFNLISLVLQLFLTRRIVGLWGVGKSLMLLPILLFFGGVVFLVFPELLFVTLLKGIDVSLKQSVNKSAMELIALPLPVSLKKKTKAYIDVVIDSLATGLAGVILILFINAAEVPPYFISVIVMILTIIWGYFVFKIRKEYFLLFRENLEKVS